MNRILSILLTLMAALAFTACSGDSGDLPEPIPESPATVGRAVLVYMTAHNNLGYSDPDDGDPRHFDERDLAEMTEAARAGALGANRLLVLHSPWEGETALKEVTAEGVKTLKSYGKSLNTTLSAPMTQAIADFKTLAPAHTYGLILWGHGSGWFEDGQKKAPRKRSYGGFETGGKHTWMNISTMADVLEGKGFDYLYFDCCFMAGVEVAYELRHAVGTVIASSSELPSEGMPYHKTLPYLMADTPDLTQAAAVTFSHFDAKHGFDRTCTISVIRTDALDGLAEAVGNAWLTATTNPSRFSVQQFASPNDYTYRYRYFDLLHAVESAATAEAAAAVSEAVDAAVVYRAATPYLWEKDADHPWDYYQVKIDRHCGLTTYIPSSQADFDTYSYSQLEWATDVASKLFNK